MMTLIKHRITRDQLLIKSKIESFKNVGARSCVETKLAKVIKGFQNSAKFMEQ